MRWFLRILKNIWIFNAIRRFFNATRYFNKKYWQILRWIFTSREDTNFTYDLSEKSLRYLTHLISIVTGAEIPLVMSYFEEVKNDQLLQETIIEATRNSPYRRQSDTEIKFGKRLSWYAFARILKPEIIVETGVDKGLGAVLLCSALLRNIEEGSPGYYYGTDINPAAGFLLAGKYSEVGKILYGDSIKSLSAMTKKIGLFINDSDHSAEYEYQEYLTIKDLMSDDAVILGDNSHDSDKLARFSEETGRNFLYFHEEPIGHWHPGSGTGISFRAKMHSSS